MSLRRTAYAWHMWLGIKFSLVLFLVLLSGTVATVSHELDWLLDPAIRAPGTDGRVADDTWDDLREAAQAAIPEGRVTLMAAPLLPGFAAEIHVAAPNGQRRRVYVHPVTAELQGQTSYLNVQRFLRSLHYNLFLPEVGLYLVSATSLLLLGSLVTGLIVYRRFWQGLLAAPRAAGTERQRWGDWHKLLGLWSLPFVLVIGLTGVWYLVEAALFDLDAAPAEQQSLPLDAARLNELGPTPVARPLAELVAAAKAAQPDFEVRTIDLVATPEEAVVLTGQTAAILVRSRANRVFLDPVSGAVLHRYAAWELTPMQRLSHTADPLHFGTWGGLASKLLYLACGVALCALQVAGTIVWWLRLRQRAARDRQAAAPPLPARPSAVPRPAVLHVLAVLLGAAILYYGYDEVAGYAPDPVPAAAELRRGPFGPWHATLARTTGVDADLRLALTCGPGCLPNVARVAGVTDAGEIVAAVPLTRHRALTFAWPASAAITELRVHEHGGAVHSWPIGRGGVDRAAVE